MAEPLALPEKKKRGCLFYAGVTAGVLLVGAFFATILALIGLRDLLRAYTGTSAVALTVEAMPAPRSDALAETVKAFRESLKNSSGDGSLLLGEGDLNALIAREPALEGKLRIRIDSDTFKAQTSIPLKGSGVPFVGDRYFNGEIAFKASFEDGVAVATIDSIVLNDKPFPEAFMSLLRSENLARDFYRRPETAEILRKFESVRVKDGKLSIKLRPK